VDEELKRYLQAMEERTATLIAATATEIQASEERTTARVAREIRASEERTAALIAAEIGSVHIDMEHRFAHVEARFDSVDARLKLQAGLIQAGARAMARFSKFSESSEERWNELDRQVEAVERKLANGTHGDGNPPV
jgi:hypothetical protein